MTCRPVCRKGDRCRVSAVCYLLCRPRWNAAGLQMMTQPARRLWCRRWVGRLPWQGRAPRCSESGGL
eukprot:8243204-Heterocapsa_arctica.AAC.1